MADRPRECPECGSDTWKAQDYDKLYKENWEIADRLKKMAAQHGLLSAQWELQKIRLEAGMKSLQQKCNRQRAALNRLENKLISLNKKPYEKVKEDESLLR